MVAKCTGIISIIPHHFAASGSNIGAFYKHFYGFTDLRGGRRRRGRGSRGTTNQVTAGEPDFGHHLARTEAFEPADSPLPGGVSSDE